MIISLALVGCSKAAPAATEQTTIAQTEAETATGDPIVAEKQEDPDTVVTGDVDISALEETTAPTTEPTTAPTQTPSETTPEQEETTQTETTPGREADGYFDYVIKP